MPYSEKNISIVFLVNKVKLENISTNFSQQEKISRNIAVTLN